MGTHKFIEPSQPVRRQVQGAVHRVEVPTKDCLGGGPTSVTLLAKFLNGDGLFATPAIGCSEGP